MKVNIIKTDKVELDAIEKAKSRMNALGVVTLRAKKVRRKNTGMTKGVKTGRVRCYMATPEQLAKYRQQAENRKRQRSVSCPYWEQHYCQTIDKN